MNSELVPGIAAAGAGSAMLTGIWLRERKAEEAMRASRGRLAIQFPFGTDPLKAKAALSGIAGLPDRYECVFEVCADENGITHFLLVPAEVRQSVTAMLSGAMPGLRAIEAKPVPGGMATVAASVFVPTPLVLNTDDPAAAVRTMLSGIAGLAEDEQVAVRWALRSGSPRSYQSRKPVEGGQRQIERAWQQKTAVGVGVRAAGLILVRAGSVGRARGILEHLTSSLRSRRGSVGEFRITTGWSGRSLASLPKTTRTSGWLTTAEALTVLGWPLGEAIPGVEVGGSRHLPVPRYLPREGRPILIGRDAQGERLVAMDTTASAHHMAVVASTGGGKSVLLQHCILSHIADGFGGIVLDPKNDLATDLIDSVRPQDTDRVIFIDPASSGPVPGLDLFGSGDADKRADVILQALRGIYKDAWGPRLDVYLRLGLRTLAELDEPVLADWLQLFTDPGLRAKALSRITDPILRSQWAVFESLSPAEQFQHLAPALSRISGLLSRPALRNIINQRRPRLSIPRLLDERRWLVVAASPGTVGEAVSSLLSAILGYLVFDAIEARVALRPDRRRPIYFVCDELGWLRLPVGLEVFFERARGLGCGVVVATQSLDRLPESTRNSLLVNVGTLIAFKSRGEEATRLAREMPPLSARDLMGLDRYEVAARIHTGRVGRGSVVVTGRTQPPPAPTGQGQIIRRLSAERYGQDPRQIEQELRHRLESEPGQDDGGYGRTGRGA